ncbi:carboxylesterase family protein [Streptomyces sp. 71268]|uniref:carboxylesterase/lipase family protein n=1 Tax=Streptomyces sp. 71268 TaxID=3002640 RepID=UPI0023F7955A|nr:carboxylesterase family protein [Streptomyces sp. 71268]WEV27420.1 carboxylesterase family protein [Streptomyces sp. 71268]
MTHHDPHPPSPTVETASGTLRGRGADGVQRFLGVPYAGPPQGAARFAPPAPVTPWPGVRDAGAHGPTAPQPRRDAFGGLDMSPYFGPGWVPGPDYLTLNVWAPAPPAPGRGLPVLVFVHGGGFVAGSGRAPLYDGEQFARDGVVLVTVNYRLGIAGFLDLPGAPPNRGLLDVAAALRWVRRHATAFGGDPDNVTLFGQSAGASLVAALLADDAAAGLFRRAIVQSGNGLGAHTPEQAARVTRAAADALGVAPTAAAFAELPDERLVAALGALAGLDLRTATEGDPLLGLSPLSLTLARQPAETLAATAAGADVTLMVGTNADEGNLYVVPQGHLTSTTRAELTATAALAHPAGRHADAARDIAAARARRPGAGDGELRAAVLGEALFGRGSRRLTQAHAAHGRAATYAYEFGWRSPALGGALGAAHAVELPFVFARTALPALRGEGGLLGPAEPAHELAARVHRAWVSFARDGDPGWAPYDPRRQHVEAVGAEADTEW